MLFLASFFKAISCNRMPFFFFLTHAASFAMSSKQFVMKFAMSCNPSKCKELVICKKGVDGNSFEPVAGIPKCDQLTILGMTFETNCRFSSHVKIKLIKANKCLHVLRCLRKEGYNQQELHHVFISLVLPHLTYGLSVYGASEAELTIVQAFLD